MLTKRESFYRCEFNSPRSHLVMHVRAWDSEEALQLFRAELRAEGVREPGKAVVVRLNGEGIDANRAGAA